ncbi:MULTISPECIES: hypothetical protein [unclassified Chelatococcus]|uniref:hypothetical protein n=1 Tax=unclassified Chelatococcus TaxID=2638111 RepID=UPI001BCC4A84|nr:MULTISPECIES: hypothetical protein [unclassified Chelatococcus]CAH1665750.1 conserved hypothetical protein [Hyphomicrobiales bacterium]MBS7737766.1 hypothetical protein [Chelatococcus sp. HY11]MBS7737925.1 hypothetical protein [Chelatococcus sp. HY11]MCO5077106.1 hypothetical protein [Chelatococcus sp.]CAH1681132.1 conserved hypothetical protein [Hyphomicrobiales bacterium]
MTIAANDNAPSARKLAMDAERKRDDRAAEKLKRSIRARQAIGEGWDGRADNDNIAWPLAKALLAEKNGDLLKYAIRYRQIEASATSGALLGGTSQGMEFMPLDQRTWLNAKGEVVNKGARKLTAVEVTGDIGTQNGAKVAKKWNGDAKVNAMIDDKALLAQLRSRLGLILEPFEDLVLHGATLERVGRALGSGNINAATGAAKAVAHMGLIAIRDALGEIRREDIAA